MSIEVANGFLKDINSKIQPFKNPCFAVPFLQFISSFLDEML